MGQKLDMWGTKWQVLTLVPGCLKRTWWGLLSPLLASMFIGDLSAGICSLWLMFADGVKLFRTITCAADTSSLKADLQRRCMRSYTWKLHLDPAKCKFLLWCKKTIKSKYVIENTAFEHVQCGRLFGCYVDIITWANMDLVYYQMFPNSQEKETLEREIRVRLRERLCSLYTRVLQHHLKGAAAVHRGRNDRTQHNPRWFRCITWIKANVRTQPSWFSTLSCSSISISFQRRKTHLGPICIHHAFGG